MEFLHRPVEGARRLGILPGTFNPVTVAHLALAEAALDAVDHAIFVLPRQFPHKPYQGASFAERAAMLIAAAGNRPRFSVAAAEGGLFLDIAQECRRLVGPAAEIQFVCGRDAAERVVNWKYDEPGIAEAMRREFGLLVATRGGEYAPSGEWRNAVRRIELDHAFAHVSATEVRQRLASGAPWEHLVPETIHEQVRRIYGKAFTG